MTEENKEEITPEPTPEPKAEPKPSDEEVTVSKAWLENVNKQLEALTFAADKGRMSNYHAQHRDKTNKRCRLTEWDGKLVVVWKMLLDDVYQDKSGRWQEKQVIQLALDGEKETVDLDYLEFTRRHKKVEAEILSETKVGDNTTLKVRTDDGREVEIDQKFIN